MIRLRRWFDDPEGYPWVEALCWALMLLVVWKVWGPMAMLAWWSLRLAFGV